MDLLIHAIIWLLKQFFGDTEKPADMDQAPRRPVSGQRPRPQGSGGAAPSLEELLAEVRREAERKQGGGGVNTPPPPQQQPVRRESSVPRPPLPSEQEHRVPKRTTVEAAPEYMPPPMVQLPKLAPVMTMAAARDAAIAPSTETPRKQKKQGKQKRVQAEAKVEGLAVSGVDSKAAIQALLQTVRSGTDQDRQMLTQQAFILKEIFGPCRSMNPYKAPLGPK